MDYVVLGRIENIEFRIFPLTGIIVAYDVKRHHEVGRDVVRVRVTRGLLHDISGVRLDPEEAMRICDDANALLRLRREGEEAPWPS
ncbi:MAG: hypothetical protein RXR82_07245 [Nitrososphaeria archaeon]